MAHDTIAAIATGVGEASIGVVRVSGPEALRVGVNAFNPKRGDSLDRRPSHSVTYGWVVTPEGLPVDEALALVMRGPHSYTGEDVVELQCHGGQVAVRRVLDAVLQAGARLAEPGEFTRQAFLNGRLDLAQAEAVIEIIRAKTDRALEAAVNQLRGGLSDTVVSIRERLLEMMAHLEADIDFPELDLEVQTKVEVVEGCRWAVTQIRDLLSRARQGKLLREGLRVVLAGRPNVGKSSLLNRLVRENRAIVTAVPGTTRDVIEEWVNIRGLPVALADTAGIRETTDVIEKLGVDRSRAMLDRADLVLLVLDASAGPTKEDRELIGLLPPGRQVVAVLNKVDLVSTVGLEPLRHLLGQTETLLVSAEQGTGIEHLEDTIAKAAGAADKEESFLANARQEEALRSGLSALESALQTSESGFGLELVSIDIRTAWMTLGEITGETVGEDLLDQIFSRFCIGK
jgi:tRNA modification GTPase